MQFKEWWPGNEIRDIPNEAYCELVKMTRRIAEITWDAALKSMDHDTFQRVIRLAYKRGYVRVPSTYITEEEEQEVI